MSKEVILVKHIPKLLEINSCLRVAAYARVSTEQDNQQNSLNVQKVYFEKFINENPKWEFKGLYTDKGISELSTKKRENLIR